MWIESDGSSLFVFDFFPAPCVLSCRSPLMLTRRAHSERSQLSSAQLMTRAVADTCIVYAVSDLPVNALRCAVLGPRPSSGPVRSVHVGRGVDGAWTLGPTSAYNSLYGRTQIGSRFWRRCWHTAPVAPRCWSPVDLLVLLYYRTSPPSCLRRHLPSLFSLSGCGLVLAIAIKEKRGTTSISNCTEIFGWSNCTATTNASMTDGGCRMTRDRCWVLQHHSP